ncbi:hypothetical protein T265_11778 [Opisthorchis viverrini]|uniref:Uncharacterized protein n=1 Tax=Opisthorchis viverrini TaxID=6198 RepID=A0A074ZW76_OPIVI|nr:hypothetical protein T265_11778 [Opisthorchis viverrini]KER19454.1 hypothetical protein T265_11778 [Opisthorchis viverrini]
MDSQSELANLDYDVLRNESARVSFEMKATMLSRWSTEYFLIRISHCCAAALLVRAGYKQNASSRIVLGIDDVRNILKIPRENILLLIIRSTLHCEHSQASQFEISRMQRLLREIFADEARLGNGCSENHKNLTSLEIPFRADGC